MGTGSLLNLILEFPQGSCLGPLLFTINAILFTIFDIVYQHLPHNTHCYAAYICPTYLSFKPDTNTSQGAAVAAMENCIRDGIMDASG